LRPVGLRLRRIRDHDQDWAQRSFTNLMELVTEGEVVAVPVPPKAADLAMTLVTIATRDHNIAFR
jgi:serine/threonine-protein kinase RIO1